jgi:hypothetical protein
MHSACQIVFKSLSENLSPLAAGPLPMIYLPIMIPEAFSIHI